MIAGALGVSVEELSGAATQAAPRIGSQLPADDAAFTGRAAATARLTALLTRPDGVSIGVPVALVTGRHGVGKTALAVHVAHALRQQFPDGQLFVRLGNKVPLDPTEVLGRLLHSLGLVGSAVPPTLDERAAVFRARLTDRRVLVMLDGAATEAQVRPLLPGTAGCAALVTSRSPLTGLLGAGSVVLDLLDQEESVQLLSRISGRDRIAAERDAAERIARACAGLPLVLRIAAARTVADPELQLAELADILDDEGRRLEALRARDVAVRADAGIGHWHLWPGPSS
jgi:hypothetical protein